MLACRIGAPLAALVTLLAAAPAHAAFTASSGVGVVDPSTGAPVVSATADGSASLAFTQAGQVLVALKQPGQPFAAPAPIGAGTSPSLAATPGGRTLLAWLDGPNVRIAFRAAGAAAFTVADPIVAPDVTQVSTQLAADGRAYVAFVRPGLTTLRTFAPAATTSEAASSIFTSGAARTVAIALQTGADVAWLAASDKTGSGAGAVASTRTRRWSPVGEGPVISLDSQTDTASNGIPPSSATYVHNALVGVSGPRPSFFWERSLASNIGVTVYFSDLMRADWPFTAAPVLVDEPGASTTLAPRRVTAAVPQDTGAALLVTGTTRGISSTSEVGGLRRAASDGSWAAKVNLTTLTSIVPQPFLSSIGLAASSGGGYRTTYTVTGRALSARISANTDLLDADPAILDQTPDASFSGAAAASTGGGDSAAAWLRTATSGAKQVQVALDDVTPPTLAVTQYARAALLPIFRTQADVDAANVAERVQPFQAATTDTWTPATLSWDFGDGTTATSASGETISHSYATSGSFKVTVTARDGAGNATTQTFDRSVMEWPSKVEPAPPGPPADAPVAKITSLKLSAASFKATKGRPSSGKTKKGTTITFDLSAAAARVELSVTAKLPGYRSGKACAAKKPKNVGRPKTCTRLRLLGLAGTPAGVAGRNTFAFGGRVAGKLLKPGRYTLTVAPVTTASHGTDGLNKSFTITK